MTNSRIKKVIIYVDILPDFFLAAYGGGVRLDRIRMAIQRADKCNIEYRLAKTIPLS